MTVVLDTSVLLAYINTGDRDHRGAAGLMEAVRRGIHGAPVIADYVIDEALTLLQRRTGQAAHAKRLLSLCRGQPGERAIGVVRRPTDSQLEAAERMFIDRFGRGLSFTDCVLVQMAQALQAPIASTDSGFDGLVQRIGL